MRGLTIIVGSGAPVRLDEAMALLAAQRALEGPATLFCTGEAVRWLIEASAPPKTTGWIEGEPSSHYRLNELLAAGARIIVCQSSLTARGLSAEVLDARIEAGGMVSLLQELGEDRLRGL